MPANDGTARVWYSTLTPAEEGIRIDHIPLDYPHEAAADKMCRAELPEAYSNALASGYWPSFDVLPSVERDAAGQSIEQQSFLWQQDGSFEVLK